MSKSYVSSRWKCVGIERLLADLNLDVPLGLLWQPLNLSVGQSTRMTSPLAESLAPSAVRKQGWSKVIISCEYHVANIPSGNGGGWNIRISQKYVIGRNQPLQVMILDVCPLMKKYHGLVLRSQCHLIIPCGHCTCYVRHGVYTFEIVTY